MAWSVRTVVVQASADSTLRTDQRPANRRSARLPICSSPYVRAAAPPDADHSAAADHECNCPHGCAGHAQQMLLLLCCSHMDDEYAHAGEEDPRMLITTSRDPSTRLVSFAKELKLVFPNSKRINRGGQVRCLECCS